MVARTLKHTLRATDLLGRWGGDEFIAIIHDVYSLGSLQDLAKKLRVMLESSRLDLDTAHISITVSIGATMIKSGETSENFFKRADELMYKSKQGGRNQISAK